MINRRGFLSGLSLLAAPVIIRTPGLLMPISVPRLICVSDIVSVTVTLTVADAREWLDRKMRCALIGLLADNEPVLYTDRLPQQIIDVTEPIIRERLGI